ncbi:S-layer homology domain-containing protein [Paenibacillus sp. N4]|uniref:S-layer homology domain-containing protein n=1 Tax=Paenibacillus vietnamensis TaxID=2590547 RepID=UPI001CD10D5B|nr:S-layer homology domain-containing protein [Paenibacillus vietnamensis]MCA0758557.1 S-layer homology domain-containing protein [Paenibacillus vietnamensis]
MMKNNRKKVAVVLSAAMLMSSLPAAAYAESVNNPVWSSAVAAPGGGASAVTVSDSAPIEADVTKEKAEALARQYVSIPKDYSLQGASFSTDMLAGGKRNVWSLDFVKKTNGKHVGSIYVRLSADDGQLLEFNSYVNNPSAKPTYPLKVEREAAGQIALGFIGKLASEYKDQIAYNPEFGVQVLPPLTGEVVHTLRYDRIVNEIPYVDNFIQVEVDSEGHVKGYSLVWDDTVTFPKVESKLTAEQANDKLRAAAAPQLSYIIPYNSQGKRKPLLVYGLQPIAIDAVTGEVKGQPEERYFRAGKVSETPVTAQPLGEKPKAGKVTEKQAVEAVKAAFELPEGAELSGSSYNEYQNEYLGKTEASWNLNWSIKKDGKEAGSASAAVDGLTGAVRNFYIYYYNGQPAGSPAITLEKASDLAVDAVKKHLPWLTHELYFVKPDPEQYKERETSQYYFSFVHKVNGADAQYDSINVAIDAKTGDVANYDAYIQNFDYPDKAPSLISKQKAVDSWLTYYRTQLTYRLVQQYSWNGQPIPVEKYKLMLASGELEADKVETKTEAELVYRLVPRLIDEDVVLDAETGEWRNSGTGETTQLEKPKATDIDGHWAQRQLELMVAYKALDVKDGKVRPNEQVTRGELIKMLVLARNSGRTYGLSTADGAARKQSFNDVAADSSYFVYVESALEQNLIDLGDGSFNPEGKVSRDDMAELIVRALGYNSLANHDQIFNTSFADASKITNKGQAAIVVGLKIMSLTGGKFQPAKQVTRAEAATAFFRYLQTRADLQEAPIRM